MSTDALHVPPTIEEVTDLCEKLKERNATYHRDNGIVSFILSAGIVLSVIGLIALMDRRGELGFSLISGLALILGGIAGVIYLAIPSNLITIARRLQLSSDPNVIPPLLGALAIALQVSKNNISVRQLRRTLATLLLRLSAEDSVVFNEENWEVLRLHLARHNLVYLKIDAADLAFAVAILDLLKRRRDTRYIATVREISYVIGAKGKQMREAAKECLAVLEEQKRKEEESQILLRASEPKGSNDTLLRPAGYSSDTQAQELLRADLSQHS